MRDLREQDERSERPEQITDIDLGYFTPESKHYRDYLNAVAAGGTSITDPLAWWLLGARVFQSLVHLVSVSSLAVTVRFSAFAVQLAIGLYWAFGLLASA